MDEPWPPELQRLLHRAIAALRRRLQAGAPTLAVHVGAWTRRISGGATPELYFRHPDAFPTLLLPWWLARSLVAKPDAALLGDVTHSSVSGYYFVRLVDDLMDGEEAPDGALLPALTLFHAEFERPYRRWFAAGHPFWSELERVSFASAEAASCDAGLVDVDRQAFEGVSATKIAGAKVPLAAVSLRYERSDLLQPWSALVDILGRWHQMRNDVRDWHRDLAAGRATYFLSEGVRRAGADRSLAEWVIGHGLEWAHGELDRWLVELISLTGDLSSPELVGWLERRRDMLAAERRELAPRLSELARLASALR